MTEWVEQQICIKCCLKLEHSSEESIWMIQKAFGDDAAQITMWHKCFQDYQESVERESHSGKPETSRTPENVEHVWAAIKKEWCPRCPSPLYSPDWEPWDFWLFPKLKSPWKGKRSQTIDEIQENMTGQLMAITTKEFAECFEQWKRCWENCVRSQAAYFEGNWGVIVLHTMFLVSFSINVSAFPITWLDTFWT